MESWAEALAMMTTEPLLLHSEVKKEELDLHHHMCSMDECSPADSSLYSPANAGLQLELELSQDAAGLGLVSALDNERHATASTAGTTGSSYHSTTPPSIARSLSSPDDLMDSPPPPSSTTTTTTTTLSDHHHLAGHDRRLSGDRHLVTNPASGFRQRSSARIHPEANLLSEAETDLSPRSGRVLCRSVSRSYSSPEPDEHQLHHAPGSASSSERTGSTDLESDAKHHYHPTATTTTSTSTNASGGEFNQRHQRTQSTTAQQQSSDFKDEDAPKRLCLVCGDVASGFHYGVASCEACKAFFKRTIQGNIEYTCPAANDCEINKRRRKACQACRFQKCIRMGMLKEGVRLDRVRGGRQKYRRVTPYTTPAQSSASGSISTAAAAAGVGVSHNASSPEAAAAATAHNGSSAKKWSIEDNKILSALEQSEPEVLTAADIMWPTDGDVANLEPSLRMLCTLSELYDRELVAAIGWAKQIPGFLEMPLNDQMRLLQTSWPEVLSLSLAYRSMPVSNSQPKLQWSSDFCMTEKEARECGMEELFFQCVQIAQRLEQLSVSREEYFLLKALVLINCDVRVESFAHVKKLRETILAALSDCTNALRPGAGQAQMFQLLLCMPSVRQVDSALRRFWALVRRDSRVPMNKLFLEMLESPVR